jgi:phosphopantetheine--protein transferase-like protein
MVPEKHNIVGCGIDIEELTRFDRHSIDKDQSLQEDICTEREVTNVLADRRLTLALRFACKEAFLKSFGASWTNSALVWKDIELLFEGPGFDNYKVHLHGYAKELLLRNKAIVGETSLDFDDAFVQFQVVLLKQEEG